MSQRFDLLDYGLAKEICKDLPKLREVLEKSRNDLQLFKKYRDAAQLIDKIDDAIIMLDLQLQVYQTKVKTRGKVE